MSQYNKFKTYYSPGEYYMKQINIANKVTGHMEMQLW
jgi:hypothetical protein